MTSQPAQSCTRQCSPIRHSHQFGGVSLIRTQMLAANALLSASQDPLPTDLNPTPVAAISVYAPQAPYVDPSPPTNPYYGVPPRGDRSIRNPNNPCDFLPNTQAIIRGGFSTIPRDVPDGDPDPKFLGPHYPPKSNDFYELTSDGRLSEVYFENARIRRFRANPGLSMLAAELSPAASDAGDETAPMASIPVPEERIYIGQGYWRQANEKDSPMQENKPLYRHKYAQEPTKIGARNEQQGWRRQPRTNDEFWRASEMMDDDTLQQPEMQGVAREGIPQIMRQEELERSPRMLLHHSIHRSAEYGQKDEEDEKFKRTRSEADIRKGRDTLFERILVQHTTRPVQEVTKQNEQESQKDEGIFSVRQSVNKDLIISNVHALQQEVLTEDFPPYTSHEAHGPEDSYRNDSVRQSMDKDQVVSNVHTLQQEVLTEEFPAYANYDAHSAEDLYSDDSRVAHTTRELESIFPPVPSGEGMTTRKDLSLRTIESSDSSRS